MPVDYFNLLTWEKWLYFSIIFVIAISFLIICIIECFLRYSKHRKDEKSLAIQKKLAGCIFLAIILLGIMPIVFIIINKLGFFKGFLFFLAIILMIISFVIIYYLKIFSKKKNKAKKKYIIFLFVVAIISIISMALISGEVDYNYRKELKEKSNVHR